MEYADVTAGKGRWSIEQADCLDWLAQLPADSVDLVFGSPPYRLARTYGIHFKLKDQAWVDWMVTVFKAALRVCKGLVAFVLEGQTKNFRWTAEPALLMADLYRAGINLRRPCIYHRVGIPGSGGPDWFRADTEFVVCATRPGKLPWSDTTACGHPPKWAPGGEMSHRVSNGARVNQWGHPIDSGATVVAADGVVRSKGKRPSHRLGRGQPKGSCVGRRVPRGHQLNGEILTEDAYLPPAVANPGNVIHLKVGGGLLGSPLAHENEAPFPQALADFFVRSCCPPDGIVADCFAGSGTTLASAVTWGRRAIGCDVRESQVKLTQRRMATVQPMLIQEG